MDGFSFDGIHSSRMGCYYHPDPKGRGERSADFEVRELVTDALDGGYYIGARVKPRAFA